MIFGWPTERSTYHGTMVNRVKSHLKRTCDIAGKEHGFVSGRITDAYGYDKVTKTIYFCEVKVNPTDLLKSVFQIQDTVFRYVRKDPQITVIPVIAVPKRLFDDWGKYNHDKWVSFKNLCKTNKIALWIIEQSDIKQIQGPKSKPLKAKTKKTTKNNSNTKTKNKRKTTKVRKPDTKAANTRKASSNIKSTKKPKSTGNSTTRKSVTKRPSSKRRVTKKR